MQLFQCTCETNTSLFNFCYVLKWVIELDRWLLVYKHETSEYVGQEAFAKKSLNICFVFYTQLYGINFELDISMKNVLVVAVD